MKVATSAMLLLMLVEVAVGVQAWGLMSSRRPTPQKSQAQFQKWCRLNFGPAWGGRGC
ncbi:accessory gland-specific peptide 70A [Drosophila miranda]|uniref:accessory gland-specific peptide 70A n=1 Tax=Drosophila miranda TaxID=7229 RepID=UPI0007E6BAB1|nr:accessory gland-specific peptide 70A [Drosophila miranda]